MVFVLMAVGGIFVLFWCLALVFASKTKGERSLGIPVFWLLVFGGLAGFGGMKWSSAKTNSPKLLPDVYKNVKQGMKKTEVRDHFGLSAIDMSGLDEVELERFDLTSNRITMPPEITGRLSPGVFFAERKDAVISVVVNGVESKRGERNNSFRDDDGPKPLLGSSAVIDERKKQGHGLKDLVIRFYIEDEEATKKLKEDRQAQLTENKDNEDFELPLLEPIAQEGKEWLITEGTDWTYTDGMKAHEVAEALATAINNNQYLTAKYELDEDALEPNSNFSVSAASCLEDVKDGECPDDKRNPFAGEEGNKLRAQVKTGENLALKLGRGTDGSAQNFFGGANEVELQFFREEDPFLDDNFTMTPRLVVAGFVSEQLFAIGQNGLELTKEEEPIQFEAE